MVAIQVRQFTTGAEVIANAKATKAYWQSLQSPPPKPKPTPISRHTVPFTTVSPPPPPKIILLPSVIVAPPVPERIRPPSPSLASIVRAVSAHYRVNLLDIASDRRTQNIVRPRQVVMYLAKSLTAFSFPAIGRYLGGRDHTTVLHGFQKIKRLRETDAELNAHLLALELELMPPPAPPADPNQLTLPLMTEASP